MRDILNVRTDVSLTSISNRSNSRPLDSYVPSSVLALRCVVQRKTEIR